jgi:hypothetical protein
MTTAAMRSPRARIVGRPGCRLSVRHSLRTEAAAALTLYGLTQLADRVGRHNGRLALGRG